MKTPALLPLFVVFALGTLVLFVIVALLGIASSAWAPLQSSTVSEVGICIEQDVFEPVTVVSPETEVLYICGVLQGETKRYVAFTMLYAGDAIFQFESNFSPGRFFIPVEAGRLHYIDAPMFPVGEYRVEASYSRDPFVEFYFYVR